MTSYTIKTFYVYILTNKRNGTLYIGATNDLERRIFEHQQNLIEGFTQKYSIHHLVYYEITHDINAALQREKQLKKWNREWKLQMIEKVNPMWKDLTTGFPSPISACPQLDWGSRTGFSRE